MIKYKDIYIRPTDFKNKPFTSGCGCFFVPAFLFCAACLIDNEGRPAFEASVNFLIHGVFVPNLRLRR